MAPRRRRYRRRRSNPLLPTGIFGRVIPFAAGFLATPLLAQMVPIELPGGKLGQYAKDFLVVTVGSQIAHKALGRKYGNALFAGGVLYIAVDMLRSYVTPFGAGVGAYLPPNDQLALTYGAPGIAACPSAAEAFSSGHVERLNSRFN